MSGNPKIKAWKRVFWVFQTSFLPWLIEWRKKFFQIFEEKFIPKKHAKKKLKNLKKKIPSQTACSPYLWNRLTDFQNSTFCGCAHASTNFFCKGPRSLSGLSAEKIAKTWFCPLHWKGSTVTFITSPDDILLGAVSSSFVSLSSSTLQWTTIAAGV